MIDFVVFDQSPSASGRDRGAGSGRRERAPQDFGCVRVTSRRYLKEDTEVEKLLTANERNARARWRVLVASAAILGLTGGSAWAAGAGEAQPGAEGDQGSPSGYSTDVPGSESSQAPPAHGGASEPFAAPEERAASVPPGTLYEMTAEQLTGKSVVDSQGDTIGEVEDLVTGGPDNRVHAVISVGGLLGVGGTEVAVPLDDLHLEGDRLAIFESKDQLKNRPEYKEENYVRIEQKDRPIADFAAFEMDESSDQPQQPSIEKGGESRY